MTCTLIEYQGMVAQPAIKFHATIVLLLLLCGCNTMQYKPGDRVAGTEAVPQSPESARLVLHRYVDGEWRPVLDPEGKPSMVDDGVPLPPLQLAFPFLRQAPEPGELSASALQITLNHGGESWYVEIRNGRTSAGTFRALPEISLGPGYTMDLAGVLRKLQPALKAHRDGTEQCRVTITDYGRAKGDYQVTYYLSDPELIRAVFVTARRYMSRSDLKKWDRNPPV